MATPEELLAKAQKPAEEVLRLHLFFHGKIRMMPKCSIRTLEDFALWDTPGVAAPCQAIQRELESVYVQTNKASTIAVISDGTRVLGLAISDPTPAVGRRRCSTALPADRRSG